MAENIVKVLDSTLSDTGPTQKCDMAYLDKDIPATFSVSIGAGDTVVLEGKMESADSFQTIYTFPDNTPRQIYLMPLWRVRRTVDGVSADSTVKVANPHNQPWTVATA